MELIKIRKKCILIILGLFLVQAFFFLYSLEVKKEQDFVPNNALHMTYSDEYVAMQQEYADGYKEDIQKIIKQADALSGISIFSKLDSFSESNLKNTKSDFMAVTDVTPVVFNDLFLRHFFSYSMINAFVLLGGIFIAFSLVDSKKRGLLSILHSAKKGRSRLVLSKIVTMLTGSFAIAVIYYLGNLIISAVYFDGNILKCLSYPIQSILDFSRFPLKMSIGMFLVCYLIYKTVMIFMITFCVWLVMYCTDNQIFSMGLVCLAGGILYLIYHNIDANHMANYLRYCNPWYLMKDISVFTEYKNLNWFNNAVNKNVFILVSAFVIMLLLFVTALLAGAKKYPVRSRYRRRLVDIKLIRDVRSYVTAIPEKMSVTLFEFYKTFIRQKGLIVIAVFILILVYQTDTTKIHRFENQEMYYEFMDNYSGVPGSEAADYIKLLGERIHEVENRLAEKAVAYEKGEIGSDEYLTVFYEYLSYEGEIMFFNDIKLQEDYIKNLKETRDIEGWYVNVYGYNHLFSIGETLGSIALIFSIVLICSGLFSYEAKHRTVSIIRGSKEGRQRLYMTKLKIAVFSSLILFAICTIIEITNIYQIYGLECLDAPAQSLLMLEFVPFDCSIGVFIVLTYALKAVVIACIAATICMLSMWVTQKHAIIILFILCVPSILGTIGLTGFEKYSVISVMSIGPLMIRTQNLITVCATVLIFVAMAVVSMIKGYKKWCIT